MILICFFFGIILWTFTEYMLHRFLGHEHKGKNFFKNEHFQHHAKFNYFAPAHKKIISALILFAALLTVGGLIFPILNVLFFLTGFFGMGTLYEVTHFRYHSKEPVAPVFIILRKHHFYHHFHNPKVNHGVTTRFWDRVFGTFIPVERVNIPEQMIMDWLMDESDLKPAYQPHFRLLRNRRK